MKHDKVDVLIIGSGASGAAVAWSLADTKMRILRLEQRDWVKPTDYVDGSIWATSGGVNPTSTIQALALYIADAIKRRLSEGTLFES